jgi:DNA-binding transcriptional ArsR family regulator
VIRSVEEYGAVSAGELPPPPRPGQRRRLRAEPFLRGPIPLAWLAKAAQLRKPAIPAGLSLWFVRGVSQRTGPIRVSAGIRKKVGLSAGQMLRGLRALEGAGLVRFVKEGRGRCPVVEIVPKPEAAAGG